MSKLNKTKVMEKRKAAFFIIAIFFMVFNLSEAAYDYFQMVQQWAPATCSSVRCRQQPPQMFTIHGLWPSNFSNVHAMCAGNPFHLNQITAAQRAQLNQFWPDVINNNNQRFWQHEWDSHGTCSENRFNQPQFFQLALDIRARFNILGILNQAGFGPIGQQRSYQHIENVIWNAIGVRPGLRCNTNTATGRRQLHEIIICVHQNGVTLIDCTNFAGSNCPANFIWLPSPSPSFTMTMTASY